MKTYTSIGIILEEVFRSRVPAMLRREKKIGAELMRLAPQPVQRACRKPPSRR